MLYKLIRKHFTVFCYTFYILVPTGEISAEKWSPENMGVFPSRSVFVEDFQPYNNGTDGVLKWSR